MKLRKNGFIYRFATYFEGDEPQDFCSLVRAVVFRTLILLFACVLSGVVVGDFFASLAVLFLEGVFFFGPGMTVATVIAGLCVLFALIHFAFNSEKFNETYEFIKTAYKSKSSKFCPTLEIV